MAADSNGVAGLHGGGPLGRRRWSPNETYPVLDCASSKSYQRFEHSATPGWAVVN